MVYGDRLMRILAEEALCRLPNVQLSQVETPCGNAQGLIDEWKLDICLVSVVRSGMSKYFFFGKYVFILYVLYIQIQETSRDTQNILYLSSTFGKILLYYRYNKTLNNVHKLSKIKLKI